MSERPHIYVPIRGFKGAMQRLAGAYDEAQRARLAEALTRHTASRAMAVARTSLISSDHQAADIAEALGLECIADPGSLDEAAELATARSSRWLILHSDLPLLGSADLQELIAAAGSNVAIAPSYDGGTTAICGGGTFPFRYGPGSAGRHLVHADASVMRPGFQLDIDSPADLAAAMSHRRGAWLRPIMGQQADQVHP